MESFDGRGVLGHGRCLRQRQKIQYPFYLRGARSACLIDCGASSMIAIRKFGVDPNSVRAILITHVRGDHFGGLPFFVLDAQLVSRRTTPLTIAGPPRLRDRLTTTWKVPSLVPVLRNAASTLAVEELEPRIAHNVRGIEVTPNRHPSGAPPFALRVKLDDKVLCYSGDTEWVEDLRPAAEGVVGPGEMGSR